MVPTTLALLGPGGRSPLRLALQVAIWAIVAIATLYVLVNAMKRNTLFFPEKYPSGLWDVAALNPRPADHAITTPDGVKLHAWLFAAAEADAPLMILFHGNGGNLTHRAGIAEGFAQRGLSVLVFDYRGYGKSEGSPSESKLYVDGLAVYDYVRQKLGAPADHIALYGESLGGAYAADVAANRPARCVVIESSFHSAASVANAVYGIPIGIFLGDSLSTARSLNRAKIPVLVMHGDADTVIPFRSGKELYDALEGPKELYVVHGADHNEVPVMEGERYFDRVVEFVRSERRNDK